MFFWDMAQCLWVNGAEHFETNDGGDYERLSVVFRINENNMTQHTNVKLKIQQFYYQEYMFKKNFESEVAVLLEHGTVSSAHTILRQT